MLARDVDPFRIAERARQLLWPQRDLPVADELPPDLTRRAHRDRDLHSGLLARAAAAITLREHREQLVVIEALAKLLLQIAPRELERRLGRGRDAAIRSVLRA